MKSHRLPAAALLAVALLLTGACGAQDDAGGTATSSPSSAPEDEVIEYTDTPDESVGVTIEKVADVATLEGAPDDFKQFVAGLIESQRGMGSLEKDCPFSVSVDVIDTSGFARGGMFTCGGAAFIWAKRDGTWQQIWGGQDYPECTELKKYSVPKSMNFDKCLEGSKAVDYTG